MKERSSPGMLVAVFCLILHMANGQSPAPKAGEPADLVNFGRVTGWADLEDEHAYAKDAGPPWRAIAEQNAHDYWNLGVEWDEPREFSEVHVTFQERVPADSVEVEYWISAWPPAEGRGGWTETDTRWQGEWRPVHSSSRLENGGMTFLFDPLGGEENPHSKNRPGYQPRFRRALKMRLRIKSSFLPVLTRFQVLGSSRWNEREVRIETGCEGTPKSDPSFDIHNGRVTEKRAEGEVIRLRLMYLEHQPGSNDGTILTVKARDLHFGVAIDDLIQRKGIYVRDAGVFVGDGADSFASYLASGHLRRGQDIYSRVGKAAEQSLERAMSEIPALSMMYRSGRHPYRYIPVGFVGSREKYGVDFNGNLFISKGGSKAFQEELSRMLWNDDTLWFRIGTGMVPDFREREGSARQHVVDDEQPVVITD